MIGEPRPIDAYLRALDVSQAAATSDDARRAIDLADEWTSRLRSRLATGEPLDVERLARARLGASSTLRLADAGAREQAIREPLAGSFEAWHRASRTLGEWLAAGRTIDLAGIHALSALVSGLAAPAFRVVSAANGPAHYAPPAFIPGLLHECEARCLRRLEEVHPIVGGALAMRWLVSIHPYRDGNGRISRLAADWIVGAGGYLPASYSSPVAAFVAAPFGMPGEDDARPAIRRFAGGIARSCEILLV